MFDKKLKIPSRADALPGRTEPMPVPESHHVNGAPLKGPFPAGLEQAMFALGCFWGAERKFWQLSGVYTTAVGYAGGFTPNPTYREVCNVLSIVPASTISMTSSGKLPSARSRHIRSSCDALDTVRLRRR